jgi:hypothetical protein
MKKSEDMAVWLRKMVFACKFAQFAEARKRYIKMCNC